MYIKLCVNYHLSTCSLFPYADYTFSKPRNVLVLQEHRQWVYHIKRSSKMHTYKNKVFKVSEW
jgi:hypothetical protein